MTAGDAVRVLDVLSDLDGTTRAAVMLVAGLSDAEVAEIGGLDG